MSLTTHPRDLNMSPNSSTTRQVFENRNLTADKYIEKFRDAGVRDVFPKEYMQKTVEECLNVNKSFGGTTLRKLLTNGRWAKN